MAKGHPGYYIGELAEVLGMSVSTVERRLRAGRFPTPASVNVHGWRLWSHEQVTELIQRKHRHPNIRL